jgi:hypothetical protein
MHIGANVRDRVKEYSLGIGTKASFQIAQVSSTLDKRYPRGGRVRGRFTTRNLTFSRRTRTQRLGYGCVQARRNFDIMLSSSDDAPNSRCGKLSLYSKL